MTPLGMMVAGQGLVVADIRINGFDLVPDLVGWVVVLVGVAKLIARSPWFTAAMAASAVGVVLGGPLLFAPPGPVMSAVESVVHGVLVFGTCTGIRDVVASERTRGTADVIRWIALVGTMVVLPTTLLVGPTEVTGPAALGVVVAVLAALAFLVWFLVFLWTNRSDPALRTSSVVSRPDPVH